MGNMLPYYFKTIYRLCVKCMPSFIKIGGAVSEKKGRNGQTFVVLYIGSKKLSVKTYFFFFLIFQDTKCGGCDRDRAANMIQLFGQPYNPNTLKSTVPSEQACMSRVSHENKGGLMKDVKFFLGQPTKYLILYQ